MAALVADDEPHVLGEEVGELALALVAPLGSDHDGRGHETPSVLDGRDARRRRVSTRTAGLCQPDGSADASQRTAAVLDVDVDGVAVAVAALEERERERVAELALDRPACSGRAPKAGS